jgi:two-component system, response regulator PdtaR
MNSAPSAPGPTASPALGTIVPAAAGAHRLGGRAEAPPGAGPDAVTPGTKVRILVVDDDRLVLATVVHGLMEAGYDVIDADNGDDAILLAREHRPQLALLDIRMEGKSGFDVAETLRDAYGIPFMFLSAFADSATQAKVQALGAEAHLIKPLDVGQIVPCVAAVLARLQAMVAATPPAALALAGAAAATGAAPPPPPGSSSMVSSVSASSLRAAAPASVAAESAGGTALEHPAPGPVAPGAVTEPAGQAAVAMAVGVLMHRYSLLRGDAARRLQRLADDNKLSLPAQAERLLQAVEELARSAV